jgi:hypothetical protein
VLNWNFIQHGRGEILDLANELGITGFCLLRKPEITYAEGLPSLIDDCQIER